MNNQEKNNNNKNKSQVARFRKKPVIIEAYQTEVEMVISTLEGDMIASPGDWIITGVNGEQCFFIGEGRAYRFC